MDTVPFFIEFDYGGKQELAEVKPCCQADNVFYYDIFIRNKYEFTITPNINGETGFGWRISLKNADNHVDEGLIDIIGMEIEKQYL
jgi:predicted secreted protein